MKKHRCALTSVLLCTLVLSVLSSSVAWSREDHGPAGTLTTKDLDRTADPIILRGEDMPQMLGLSLEGFRLFASQKGRLLPVPFQVDEVDAKGLYVLPEGKRPNRDTGARGEEQEKHGVLDTNDELVWMAGDLGDRIPAVPWPVNASNGIEIEAFDPGTGKKGWAYLLWFSDPPPRAEQDYVSYARQEDRIYTSHYILGYSPERDLVYTTELLVTPTGGGDNTGILDRINIRFSAITRMGSVTFSRTEDDFVSEVIAYKDGPVRVMRRVSNSMRLVLGIRAPKTIAYSMYYRDSVGAPNEIRIPVEPSSLLSQFTFEGGSDYTRRAIGMRFYSSNNPQGVVVDGLLSPEERALDRGKHHWTLITGDQGTILARLELGPRLRDVIDKVLLYDDDVLGANPPEKEPGTTPKIAIDMKNLLALKRGRYRYNLWAYFLPDPEPATQRAYLDILDNPLQVRVSEARMSSPLQSPH